MDVHHLLILKILKNRELSELYAMMSLRSMAMSLISIFVPIYLYTLGYGIPTILLFYIAASATHALMSPVSAKISSHIGFKHGMLLGFLGYFLYYVMLAMLGTNSQLLYITAATYGVSQAFFWIPFHAFFPALTDSRKRGEEVALLQIFPGIFSIIAPLISGLIIFFADFDTLFIAGLGFLMAAAFPLLMSKDIRMPFRFSMQVKGFDKRLAVSLVSYSDILNETLWPIFIFTIVGSAAALGGIMALGVLVGFAIAWIIGSMCDRGYRKKILQFGSVGQSVIWTFRAFASNLVYIVGVESAWRFVSKFTEVSYNSAYYERARKARRKLEFAVLREISINASVVGVFALIYLFYSHIPNLAAIFIIALIGPLTSMLIEAKSQNL